MSLLSWFGRLPGLVRARSAAVAARIAGWYEDGRGWVVARLGRPAVQPVRPLAHLFAYYPLLLVIAALTYALVWGVVLTEYDAFRLVWHDRWWVGIGNGVGVGMVLGGVLLAAFLLDHRADTRPHGAADPAAPAPPPPHPAGYWVAWWGLLVAAALPAVALAGEFRVRYPVPDGSETASPCDPPAPTVLSARDQPGLGEVCRTTELARLWFPLGLVGCGAGFTALRLLARRPAGEAGPNDRPVRFARWLGGGLLGLYVAAVLAHLVLGSEYLRDHLGLWPDDRHTLVVPAPWSVLFLVGLLTAGAWQFTKLSLRRAWWAYPALLGLVVVPFLLPGLETDYRVPGLEAYYRPGSRPSLADYELYRRSDRGPGAGLVPDADALTSWHARMRDEYGEHRPVVLVTVSGGASASALYTADVLFTLEAECPGFSDQVRVISGASGGMLGAAYYVAQFRPHTELAKARHVHAAAWKAYWKGPPADRPRALDAATAARAGYVQMVRAAREKARRDLGRDFLGPLLQQWALKDVPLYLLPLATTNDRGRALEYAWNRRLGPDLDVPFAALRGEERAGQIPSLVFTPMMIEDGRQLIVSNLDLDYMADSVVPNRPVDMGSPEKPSHTGVEFFRLFPGAAEFKLRTAVRLSASFPFMAPAAALPTNPVRHLVDAGYYDNYGTLTATRWVAAHADWLQTAWWADAGRRAGVQPGVFLLQIRCFAYEKQTREFLTQTEKVELVRGGPAGAAGGGGGLFTVSAPLTGLFASWRANMVYRGDERVDAVSLYLRDRVPRDDPNQGRVRVDRVLFECPFEPSLNWTLTDAARWRLSAGGPGMIEPDFDEVRQAFIRRGREDADWVRGLQAGWAATDPLYRAVLGPAAPPPPDPPMYYPPPVEEGVRGAAFTGTRTPASGRRELYWRLFAQESAAQVAPSRD